MKEDILNFEVRFYSPDGANSPVIEYLVELYQKDEMIFKKCTSEITDLPKLIFARHKDIKPFKTNGESFFELKVRYKNNAFRFFFVLKKPNIIVVYGFTKKTQKTEKKDINKGLEYLKDYSNQEKSLSLNSFLDKL
jgi:phage-related protein